MARGTEGAVDWEHAARRAAGVVKAGPPIDRPGLEALVGSLRSSAVDAPAYVADVTGLTEAAERAADGRVLVVDRARWSAAAADTFRAMAGEALPTPRVPGAARVAGEQLGWALGLLSTRILGQYDPYVGDGRLLLVAPNVLAVQRQLDADAADFHLWVCLHEQTHAVQFAAAPWLGDHLVGVLQDVLRSQLGGDDDGEHDGEHGLVPNGADSAEPHDDDQADAAGGGLAGLLSRLTGATRSGTPEVPGLLAAILPREQQEQLTAAIAVMSLLEGHADVVMDEVGPRAIPTVRSIREAFERRRDERTLSTLVMRRLLGMDAKLLQYRNGAAFVRGVREQVGHAGLNAVWSGPEALPTPAEIADPAAWVTRVHG